MQIVLNGERSEVSEPCTIARLLASKNSTTRFIVVEVNKSIVKRDTWETTLLKPGDAVEIVTFVGGG